jgi:hypothetical protein
MYPYNVLACVSTPSSDNSNLDVETGEKTHGLPVLLVRLALDETTDAFWDSSYTNAVWQPLHK